MSQPPKGQLIGNVLVIEWVKPGVNYWSHPNELKDSS